MTVYVDPLAEWGMVSHGRPTKSCHMVADTDAELHRMARRIGLKRSWYQRADDNNQYRRHYDLTPSRRMFALRNGAKPITHRQLVDKISHKPGTR